MSFALLASLLLFCVLYGIVYINDCVLFGQTRLVSGDTIVEHAESAGINIPTNCTSGTCGTCMITLLSGDVPLPDILPPGLDEYMIEQNARLGCIGIPVSDCEIDIRPPL